MSTRMETRIANANAAPISTVNTVVCVMNPGPMALVAMRNIAPSDAVNVAARAASGFPPTGVLSAGLLAAGVLPSCSSVFDMSAPFYE